MCSQGGKGVTITCSGRPSMETARWLHSFVARAAAALGAGPADIVKRAFPLAGFAVQTVRRVGRLDLVANRLIDAGRAKHNARAGELRRALIFTNFIV